MQRRPGVRQCAVTAWTTWTLFEKFGPAEGVIRVFKDVCDVMRRSGGTCPLTSEKPRRARDSCTGVDEQLSSVSLGSTVSASCFSRMSVTKSLGYQPPAGKHWGRGGSVPPTAGLVSGSERWRIGVVTGPRPVVMLCRGCFRGPRLHNIVLAGSMMDRLRRQGKHREARRLVRPKIESKS